MKKTAPFVMRLTRSELLTPEEYLKLSAESPRLIRRAEFIPPMQGRSGFGMFAVTYSRARSFTPRSAG